MVNNDIVEVKPYITKSVLDVAGYNEDCAIYSTISRFLNEMADYPKYKELLAKKAILGRELSQRLKVIKDNDKLAIITSEYYLIPICRFIDTDDFDSAVNAYIGMIKFLEIQLNIENNMSVDTGSKLVLTPNNN